MSHAREDASIFDNVLDSEAAVQKWRRADSKHPVQHSPSREASDIATKRVQPPLSAPQAVVLTNSANVSASNPSNYPVVNGGGLPVVVNDAGMARNYRSGSGGSVYPSAPGGNVDDDSLRDFESDDGADNVMHGRRSTRPGFFGEQKLSNLESGDGLGAQRSVGVRKLSESAVVGAAEDINQAAMLPGQGLNGDSVVGAGYSVVGVVSKDDLYKDYYVEYVVGSSETIENISKFFHVPISVFIQSFAGYTDTTFTQGTKIMVPVLHHSIRSGESLVSIARRYGVSTEEIKNTTATFGNKVSGSLLILPILDTSRKVIVHKYTSEDPRISSEDVLRQEHFHSGVTENNVVPMPIKNPFVAEYKNPLVAQMRDGPINDTQVAPFPLPVPLKKPFKVVPEKKSGQRSSVENNATVSAVEKKAEGIAPGLSTEKGQNSFSGGFIWPLKGDVVTAFTTAANRKSDGIEIRGATTNVRAAADGVVVYVGANIAMYSKLIIIKHKDDKITIYGNNVHVFVKNGDSVSQGQIISKIGKTENVKNPKLYFGMRQGRKILDPIKYLS